MIRAHVDAIRALLDGSGLAVYTARVPTKPALPYVWLIAAAPQRQAPGLDGGQRHADAAFQTTTVGGDAQQLGWAQERVHAALVDARPDVPGRRTSRISHEAAQPTRADDDVDPPRVYAVDQWAYLSVPAPQ